MIHVWIHRICGDLIVPFARIDDAYDWTVNIYASKFAPDEFSIIPTLDAVKASILSGNSLPIMFCTYFLQVSIVHSGFMTVTDELWVASEKLLVTKEEAINLGESISK